jgi:hypothetical protein
VAARNGADHTFSKHIRFEKGTSPIILDNLGWILYFIGCILDFRAIEIAHIASHVDNEADITGRATYELHSFCAIFSRASFHGDRADLTSSCNQPGTLGRKPHAVSRKPQAAGRKPQAASR